MPLLYLINLGWQPIFGATQFWFDKKSEQFNQSNIANYITALMHSVNGPQTLTVMQTSSVDKADNWFSEGY